MGWRRKGLTRAFAFTAVTPWCLAAGLLVSFAADAGQGTAGFGARAGLDTSPARAFSRVAPGELVPSSGRLEPAVAYRPAIGSAGLVSPASLTVGSVEDLAERSDEVEPRMDMKLEANADAFPSVDRAHKGNLEIGLRGGYESKLIPSGSDAQIRKRAAFFGQGEDNAATPVVTLNRGAPPGRDAVASFETTAPADALPAPTPAAPMEATLTAAATSAAATTAVATTAVATTAAATSAATISAAAPPRAFPGAAATPFLAAAPLSVTTTAARRSVEASAIVPRAMSLAPTTPVSHSVVTTPVRTAVSRPAGMPVATAPLQPAAAAVGLPAAPTASPPGAAVPAHPNYLALIAADKIKIESQCLAEAIYFEGRSEPDDGQAAIAQVVLNRVASGLYPNSICGVVYQNQRHYLGCQFSFACEGKSLRVTEAAPWTSAQRIAHAVLEGETYLAKVGGATHYHARYVRPYWASSLTRTDTIGQHVFYKMRGQL